jgi:hypothetical protein
MFYMGFGFPYLLLVAAGFLTIDVLLGLRALVLTVASLWLMATYRSPAEDGESNRKGTEQSASQSP